MQVEYDCGRVCWHEDDGLCVLPLLASSHAGDALCSIDEWTQLELRCVISRKRLTSPARGSSCTHLSRCNLAELESHRARSHTCPIAGCNSTLRRRHDVWQDTRLQLLLSDVPAHVEHVWLRGNEIRLNRWHGAGPASQAVEDLTADDDTTAAPQGHLGHRTKRQRRGHTGDDADSWLLQ